jgi:hypothetical protein
MTPEDIARMSPEEHLKTLAQANKDYWDCSTRMQSQWRSGVTRVKMQKKNSMLFEPTCICSPILL